MLLRLVSDIHLELAKNTSLLAKTTANLQKIDPLLDNVLILAGDIGNPTSNLYRSFLTDLAKSYSKIFVVAGNHEYYRPNDKLSMKEVDQTIRTITNSIPNIHFLQQNSYVYQRVRFLGCTLWSASNPSLASSMNDYHVIPRMTPAISNELHQKDVSWLRRELDSSSNEDYDHTVVITHHLPSFKLVSEKYRHHHLNCFFASDLDQLVTKSDIWCCGHSHHVAIETIGNCRCYLNPIGYEREDTGFQENLRISLEKDF